MILSSDCAQVLPVKSFLSRSLRAVIRVCDDAGTVIETREHKRDSPRVFSLLM